MAAPTNDIANPYGETFSEQASREARTALENQQRRGQGQAPISEGAPVTVTPDNKTDRAYDYPATPSRPEADVRRARAQAEIDAEDAPGFVESMALAAEVDSPTVAAWEWLTEDDPEADADWRVTDEQWQRAIEGIPADRQERLADATSEADLYEQANDLRHELDVERQLASAGMTGMSARITAGLLDPSSLALAATTGGVGYLAGAVNTTAKLGRIGRAVAAGAAGSAEGVAAESIVAEQRQTHDLTDVLIAGATGGALGFGLGALGDAARGVERSVRNADGTAKGTRAADDEAWQAASGAVASEAADRQTADILSQARMRPESRPEYQAIADDLNALDTAHVEARQAVADAEARLTQVRRRDPLDDLAGTRRADDSRAKDSRADATTDDAGLVSTLKRAADSRTAANAGRDLPGNLRRVIDEDAGPNGVSPQTEAVYRALMPGRRTMGRRDALKTKARIDGQIRQAEQAQAARIADAEVQVADAMREVRRIEGEQVARRADLDRLQASETPATGPGADDLARTDAAGADAAEGQAVEASVLPDQDLPAAWYSVEPARYGKARFSLTGRLKGQDRSATLRGLADRMFADAVGPAKGSGETATYSAAEEQDRLFMMAGTKVQRAYLPAHKRWAEERGMSVLNRNSEDSRATFGALVTRYIRTGEADSQAVRDAGEAIADQQTEMLRNLKDAGVEGFENVAESRSYMTRQWLANRFVALNRDPDVGPDAIRQVLTKAITNANDDIDPELAEAMGRAIFDRYLRKGHGIDLDLNRVLFGRDIPLLEQTLRDAGMDDSNVSRITRIIEDRQGNEQSGRNARAKSRIDMDEGASIELPNGSKLHVSDLMENDAEQMAARYLREMSGHVAVARTLRRDGVDGPINVERYIERAVDQARAEGATQEDIARFEMGFRQVLGQPPTDTMNTGLAQLSRFVRGWNMTRLLGSVGFAQVGEYGPLIGQAGFSSVASRIPMVKAMVTRAQDGTINDDLMRDIEETIGAFGAERMIHQPRLKIDDYQLEMEGFGPISRKAMQRVDGVIQKAQRGVADFSTLAPQTIMQQRVAVTAMAQKFLNMSLDPRTVNMERMRAIGLSDDMLDRVLGQVRRHHKAEGGVLVGRKLTRLNLDAWDDLEARDALAHALHKSAFRMIQRNFVGELPAVMDTELGKLLGQFRTFVVTAHEKQLLHHLNHRDAETAMTFLASSLFAGLGYVSQTYLNSLGRDDAEQYRRERLAPAEIGKAAFARAGYAALLPGMLDTAGMVPGVIDQPFFGYSRSTGLAMSFIEGVPSVDLATSIGQTISSTSSAWRSDRTYTGQDFDAMYSLIAFNNAQFFRQVGDLVSQDLPRWPMEQPRTVEDYFDN